MFCTAASKLLVFVGGEYQQDDMVLIYMFSLGLRPDLPLSGFDAECMHKTLLLLPMKLLCLVI
jgi:hypothetical protein